DNDEGRLVANTINNLLSEDNFSDFAILYRTNAQSRALEESLRKMGIPYKIYGGLSFYQRKEIKDLLGVEILLKSSITWCPQRPVISGYYGDIP
ncbi:MAG: hypothetical protein CL914_08265, partial [Deltaproteobacteria bacterium]|nr:hypothetical protein [Deltaproteobacteria bacterium]